MNNFYLVAVITRPDKLVGRNRILSLPPPKQFALSHNINTFTPRNRGELLYLKEELTKLKPDLSIVADYRLMIPEDLFSLPRYQTVNIHFSKLPQLRGPSPVQYTLLNGDPSAWISFMLLTKDLDAGDILEQIEVPLKGNETTDSLYRELFNITANTLPEVINKYVSGQSKPIPQDQTQATYTKIFTKDDGFIPFELLKLAIKGEKPNKAQLTRWPLSLILPSQFCTLQFALCTERAVRALSPWPGVWTTINLKSQIPASPAGRSNLKSNKRLIILKAHLEQITGNRQQATGTRLVLDTVQLEGKKPVTFKQFREGYPNVKLK